MALQRAPAPAPAIPGDIRAALVEFAASIPDLAAKPAVEDGQWTPAGLPPCSGGVSAWKGVDCEGDEVFGINFQSVTLASELPFFASHFAL